MTPPETRLSVIEAVRNGLSYHCAGSRYGVSATSARRWCRKAGVEATDSRYGPMRSDVGITWRRLEELEQTMPFCDAVDKVMLEYCA